MLVRRGYNPKLSFAAFEGDQMLAFTFNGTGIFNGRLSAYDIATGAIRKSRGQGLVDKIFTHSLPFLREAGVEQYVLEVLENNKKAIAIYSRLGFTVSRHFDCFRQAVGDVVTAKANTVCAVLAVDADAIRSVQEQCDTLPSWQNSPESLERGFSDLRAIGAFVGGNMVGHCVFDPRTGDVSRLAVSSGFRRRGIASRLLKEALALMEIENIKILNIPADSSAVKAFLQTCNIPLASSQYEMIMPLG